MLSYPEFDRLRAGNSSVFGNVRRDERACHLDVAESEGTAGAAKAQVQLVSGELTLEVLGVKAALGRVFTPQEDQAPGANPVAVISYGFWERTLAGDRGALSKKLRIGRGALFHIVGICAAGVPRHAAGKRHRRMAPHFHAGAIAAGPR